MRSPRTRWSRAGGSPRISAPRNLTLPRAGPFAANNPMIDMKIWLLPEPDSPTTPTVSPGPTAKLTSLTALTSPSGVSNTVSSPSTSRVGTTAGASRASASAILGIEGIAQPVPDEVEAEQRRGEEDGGEHQRPPGGLHRSRALADQHAPARVRLLHAEAEEADEGFGQDDVRHRQRDIDDDRPERVGDDVAAHDVEGRDAAGDRRLDELLALEADRLAAHDARHVEPGDGADADIDEQDVAAEHDGEQDHEEQERQRVEHVDGPHHHGVDAPAEEAGGGAPDDADGQADQGREDADGQRRAAAVEGAHEQVAAVLVGAEEMRAHDVRRRRDQVPIDLVVRVRAEIRREGRGQRDAGEQDRAADGGAVAQQPAPSVGPQAASLEFLCAGGNGGRGHSVSVT